MRNGAGRTARGGEGQRPRLPLEGGVWGLLGGWPILREGTLPGFPSPHLRHFPERISAVRVVVLRASGNCEACACRMVCSFVVFRTRHFV